MDCHWRRSQQALDIFNAHLVHHVCSYLYMIQLVSSLFQKNENILYHTGQLSVALSKSNVPSAWQAMLKVDFDRSDSQKRVGVPSIFAPCSLWSVLDLGNIFVVLVGPNYAPVLCIAHCVLCQVRWHCIFYDAVTDTIRRRGWYRAIITEEGVDTVTYFGGNHGSKVWK